MKPPKKVETSFYVLFPSDGCVVCAATLLPAPKVDSVALSFLANAIVQAAPIFDTLCDHHELALDDAVKLIEGALSTERKRDA